MPRTLDETRAIVLDGGRRGARPLEKIIPGDCVMWLCRNESGYYQPGWAKILAVMPSGKIKIDPFCDGKPVLVSEKSLIWEEWATDMERKKHSPCQCGHSNHEDHDECYWDKCTCTKHITAQKGNHQ